MKIRNLAIFSALVALTAPTLTLAKAGGMEGGGGKGILCRSAEGEVLRTLDLWEAENVLGLKLAGSATNLNQNLEEFGLALWRHRATSEKSLREPDIGQKIRKILRANIVDHFRFIPAGQRLPLTKDATIPELPAGCSVVQIAIYHPDDTIEVDGEYWGQLDAQEQAALVLHEQIYFQARRDGAIDSDESRHVVALIFAKQNPEPMFSPLWESPRYLSCFAQEARDDQGVSMYQMYAVDEQRGDISGVALYFKEFNGKFYSTRTSAFIENLTTQQLKDENFGAANGTAVNAFFHGTWNFTLEGHENGLLVSTGGGPKSVGWCSWVRN